eukprot:7125067-Pyramimonas_sp.AAC.1
MACATNEGSGSQKLANGSRGSLRHQGSWAAASAAAPDGAAPGAPALPLIASLSSLTSSAKAE